MATRAKTSATKNFGAGTETAASYDVTVTFRLMDQENYHTATKLVDRIIENIMDVGYAYGGIVMNGNVTATKIVE